MVISDRNGDRFDAARRTQDDFECEKMTGARSPGDAGNETDEHLKMMDFGPARGMG